MSNFPYPKGSVWRKWDLQIQTILDDQYTPLRKYYESIKAAEVDKWNEYIAKVGGEDNALLFDSKEYFSDSSKDKKERCQNYVRNVFAFLSVFSPDLACLGITDHNYYDDELLDTFIDYSRRAHCKIIPGVEINCTGIHMILFFPNTLYGKPTFSQGIHAFLVKFGINNQKTAGVLTTTSVNIKDIIDETEKNGGLVIYPHCNSANGLFQERTNTDRTHLADIFNHQKMNLLQSQNHGSSQAISEYIDSNAALKSKFCCHISSDTRSLQDFGKADEQGNYLWIKADPNFEGLKQIGYESDQRIYVGPEKPEIKKSYFVIERARFIDNTNDIKFASETIELNPNLTTIIGGKSTGKSLLLYYIAKTIDPLEVAYRTESDGVSTKYDFDSSPDFNFEVTWNDGQKSLLKTAGGPEEIDANSRKILYIPQKYLNTLSETNIESREALNEFVLGVILQDTVISTNHSASLDQIKTVSKSISVSIGDLFSDTREIETLEEELKQAGNEKGIQSYIEELQLQVNEIKAKSGLNEQEIAQYEKLRSEEKTNHDLTSSLTQDRQTIISFQNKIEVSLGQIAQSAADQSAYINDEEVRTQFTQGFNLLNNFAPAVSETGQKLVANIDARLAVCKSELARINAEIAPIIAKIHLQSELQSKSDAIKAEQSKLADIGIKRKSLATKKAAYEKRAESILTMYQSILDDYESLRNEFKQFESKFGEISLGVHANFNSELFNANVVAEYLNKSDLKRVIEEAEWGKEFVYQYDATKHINNIRTVFTGLLSGSIKTVKNRQVKDAIANLLENYFYLDFKIFYKNDSLDKMSPGKKGLVLLQLLINLSDKEWPVLLDQPEDDLDNRSVYDDLVDFLKKKKLQRQIIIVTHNPNLVVGADSEEVIVANQSGQEVGRENKTYRFEYVSEALENTFELEATVEPAILLRKGIREHVCEILEGGKEAFQKREQKYSFPEK